ncbi:MAG: helix-turn-helix domain-containing protein [Pseudohongiellaceae bacterium]
MRRTLNIERANQAMDACGLNQATLAKRMEVSKEAVSQWFRHHSFPRPDKLLKLAKLLKLSFTELVIKEEPEAPVIAFRRMRGTVTKDHHIEKAQDMGRLLRELVPYLPFDTLEVPPVLKEPGTRYDYIQQVVAKVRQDLMVSADATLDFHHLIRRFAALQTVLIPVLWGNRKRHENALHIYLPDSRTTWVYLNLDVNLHDFKFWMAHELGHCLSPDLRNEDAEDFADAFAGALLFPKDKAEAAYACLKRSKTAAGFEKRLFELAKREIISPYTILMEVNKFAEHFGHVPLKKDHDFFKDLTRFNQQYPNVSKIILDTEQTSAADFVSRSGEALATPFFGILRQYLSKSDQGPSYVQTVMDLPLLDAKGIHAELS